MVADDGARARHEARVAVAERYRRFADEEARPTSPLYGALAYAVADDPYLNDYASRLPDTQPNLLFAAVQYLTGPANMPSDGSALRALLTRLGDEVAEIVRTRRVQTNEVARCAVLLPALPPGPLALLEVGASAGLCLLLDRYAYDYGAARVGDSASGVTIRCRASPRTPVPHELPTVVWRRGVDLAPLDVRDDDDVRWLTACVWADHAERRTRLHAAVRLARDDPAPLVAGDLVEELPRLAAAAPDHARLVVYHGGVLAYLAPERRAAFAEELRAISERRRVLWLSNEGPGVLPDTAPAPGNDGRLRFVLTGTSFTRRFEERATLALSDPHGADLEWLA